ncbi:MAG: hypothetical protein G01um101466_576 [Parcubacteria group bacterium Gr01-1014_66]|nr:MAG: hypothetical protein G01um101466_576 [Parcubacteria group bacterium Gr01-1014_66]
MKVAVGSLNPVKIDAVTQAFFALFPHEIWEVEGVAVSSGVRSQPMSDMESIEGARNRACAAQRAFDAEYGVGLEGGLHQIGEHFFDAGWIVVRNRQGEEGIGSTAKIMTPPKIMKLVKQGMELGNANDFLFGATNSKQAEGHFGLMTKNTITRTQAYRDAVIVALSRFLHPHLFEN